MVPTNILKLTCDSCPQELGVIWDDGYFCQKVQCFDCYIKTQKNVLVAKNKLKNMKVT